MIARLVRSADFERVLRTRSRVSSIHFALHHVAARPGVAAKPVSRGAAAQLSTDAPLVGTQPVDDMHRARPEAVWLGVVVPKRHARRSVTRTLIKRQIRAVVTGSAGLLAGGLWVVRLRAPFDKTRFVSASSEELRRVAREELEGLIGSAAERIAAGA